MLVTRATWLIARLGTFAEPLIRFHTNFEYEYRDAEYEYRCAEQGMIAVSTGNLDQNKRLP